MIKLSFHLISLEAADAGLAWKVQKSTWFVQMYVFYCQHDELCLFLPAHFNCFINLTACDTIQYNTIEIYR